MNLKSIFIRKPTAYEENKIETAKEKLIKKLEEIVSNDNHEFYSFMRAITDEQKQKVKEDCAHMAVYMSSVQVSVATKYHPCFWINDDLAKYFSFLKRPIVIHERLFDYNDDSIELREILIYGCALLALDAVPDKREKVKIRPFEELIVRAGRWSGFLPFYL